MYFPLLRAAGGVPAASTWREPILVRLTGQSVGPRMRAAAIQLNSTGDKARNVAAAERLVRAAAADGAGLAVLPEKWNLLGDSATQLAGAEPLDGPTISAARAWARELGIHLLAGSIVERVEGQEKACNTSTLIGPDGGLEARYRKIHMFDVDVGGVVYRESDYEEPGDEVVSAALGAPLEDVTLGLTVCYDLRFPQLYRILAVRGATVITVHRRSRSTPARITGRLLRAARSRTRRSWSAPTRSAGAAHYRSTAAPRS
jgi:predicted amidohydrolase